MVGIPEGSFVIFTGPPKVGKTSLALDFASTAQRKENSGKYAPEGRRVFVYNIEGRLKPRDLKGIRGLLTTEDRLTVVESKPGNILSAEKYLSIGEQYITAIPGSIHIFDSFSALCTEAEYTAGMDKMQRADGPKLLAKFCRKVANIIPVNKNIVIGITHIMGNPSGMGAETKEKSGFGIAYACDVKLYGKYKEDWTVGSGENQTLVGQKVHWQVITSAIGPPGAKLTSYLRYGEGIDKEQELLDIAISANLVEQKGAWYNFSFMGEKAEKFQGAEKCRQALVDNPDLMKKLEEEIKNLLC